MGNCAGMSACTKGRSGTRYKVDKYDQQPIDTELYKDNDSIKLPFSAIFGNVKIKKCPYKSIGMKISIDSEEYYQLANKRAVEGQSDIKWKIQKRIDFLKSEYEIRKSFVNIDMMDDSQKLVGKLRINLYTISIGPYHQDFLVEFKNGKVGRVSFDFKVSQLIQVELESLEAEMTLNKKHPGENFSFSIKTIVSNDAKVSHPSYPVQVVLDQKNSSQKLIQEEGNPKPLRRRTSMVSINQNEVKELKEGNNLFWNKKTPLQQMPSLSIKILLNELHHSYFQILLIKYKDQNIESQNDIKQELFAESYISFHKLFTKNDPDIFVENGISYESRKIEVNEKLWIHGKQIGRARLIFYVKNQKYIKQMQVCVRTQEGILKTSPVFGIQEENFNRKEASCSEIDELSKLNEQLQSYVIQLEQCQDGYFEIRKLKSKIEQCLEHMIPILQKTNKESIICYTYYSPKEMIKGQKVLIDIGMKIISYLQEEDLAINELCWIILIALIKRGEFMLNHIGFDDAERNQIEADNLKKITKKKLLVAFLYQKFMYKLLDLALKSLNNKGSELERSFAEIFCAYAYFRIPDFRESMLKVITKEEDPQVEEWRGIEFSLNEDVDYVDYTVLKQDVDSFTALFDWQHSFHKCLKNISTKEQESSSKEDNSFQLSQILHNDNWKDRFRKRGPAFFSFIKYWISYVEGIVIKSRDIQWKYFPGYNRLLKAFFLEMKRRKVLEYPDALKQTANRLIANEKIFSPIVIVLFSKANIYQPLVVLKVLDLISDLLFTLQKRKKAIPTLFNYSIFFQAIKICLQSEFLFLLQSTLILIYTHFQMFHVQFRKNLCLYLLKKVFFKLFLHWSDIIRNVFMHLLVYRISHEVEIPEFDSKDLQLSNKKVRHQYIIIVKPQYENTLKYLEAAREKHKQKNTTRFITSYDKNLHKVMKKKLIDKKLAKAKKQLLSPRKKLSPIKRPNCVMEEESASFTGENQTKTIDDEKLKEQTNKKNKRKEEERFIQPRVERSQSECITKSKAERIYKNVNGIGNTEKKPRNKEEEVIQLNKSNSFTIKNQILDTTQLRDSINDSTKDLSKSQKIQNNLNQMGESYHTSSNINSPLKSQGEQELNSYRRRTKEFNPIFQIFDEQSIDFVQVTEMQLQYIPVAYGSYQQIKADYERSLKLCSDKLEVPKIKRQQMAIDQKELRPDKMDDW